MAAASVSRIAIVLSAIPFPYRFVIVINITHTTGMKPNISQEIRQYAGQYDVSKYLG